MGATSKLAVLCVFVCVTLCKGQFNTYGDLSSLSRILQTLAYGRRTTPLPQLAPTNAVQRLELSEQPPTKQSLTAPVDTYNQLLGLLASRWGGMQQQIETRLETMPENKATAAEQRVNKANDYFENVQEQQLDQSSKGWNNYMSNQWSSTDDNTDEPLEQLDQRVENRIDLIETVYGEQAADAAENTWETNKAVIEDTVDAVSDVAENVVDTFSDTVDNLTDDWDLSFDNYDDNWDNNDYSNFGTTNSWGNDQEDSWSQYSRYSF